MKTIWQKTYSFFGFWSYLVNIHGVTSYRVIYWCLFPEPFPFFRKIDLFKVKV